MSKSACIFKSLTNSEALVASFVVEVIIARPIAHGDASGL